MPQITLEQLGIDAAILIKIPNVVFEATEVKRMAQVMEQKYEPATKRCLLSLLIFPYSKVDDGTPEGDYGVVLQDHPLFRIESLTLTADNETIVNMLGQKLVWHAPADVSDLEEEGGVLHGVEWMRQGDWFRMIAKTQKINVDDMITREVQSYYGVVPQPDEA